MISDDATARARQKEEAYWRARREELLAQMAEDEAELFEKLEKLYAEEAAKLEREIASYYQRFGEDNVIEYRKLLVTLSDEDVRLLMERMDDFAKKYPQYAHLLPVRESIYKLDELEGLQAAIRLQQLKIGAIEQDAMEEHFERQAQRGANYAAEQMGFGENFYTINAQVIADTVGQAWASGKSFSERIWENREALAAYLNDDFAKLIARGVAYDKLTKQLTDRFENTSSRNAKRLVYTEGTFLFNEAQAQVHEEDFEFYVLSTIHDAKTCDVCRDVAAVQGASPTRFSERKPGVNFPPLHPWCRCSYEVSVEDWDAWIEDYVAKHGGDRADVPFKMNLDMADIGDELWDKYRVEVAITDPDGEDEFSLEWEDMNPESVSRFMDGLIDCVGEGGMGDCVRFVGVDMEDCVGSYDCSDGTVSVGVNYFMQDTYLLDDDLATASDESLIDDYESSQVHRNATVESAGYHEGMHARTMRLFCKEYGLKLPMSYEDYADHYDFLLLYANRITDAAWERYAMTEEGERLIEGSKDSVMYYLTGDPEAAARTAAEFGISAYGATCDLELIAEAGATVYANGRDFNAFADIVHDVMDELEMADGNGGGNALLDEMQREYIQYKGKKELADLGDETVEDLLEAIDE